jgi:transposase
LYCGREVQDILSQIFYLNISLGLISNTAKRVNKQLGGNYEDLQEQVACSSYMHIDETGHKNKGKRGWAWVFTNKNSTVLHLSSSRGKKVLADVLGNYEGYVIRDRYGAYNYFDENKRT